MHLKAILHALLEDKGLSLKRTQFLGECSSWLSFLCLVTLVGSYRCALAWPAVLDLTTNTRTILAAVQSRTLHRLYSQLKSIVCCDFSNATYWVRLSRC
jgi:hypothetical protein